MIYLIFFIISVIILLTLKISWNKFLNNEVVSKEDKKTVLITTVVLTIISSVIVVPLLVDLENYWCGIEIIVLMLTYGLGMSLIGFVSCYNKYRRLLG